MPTTSQGIQASNDYGYAMLLIDDLKLLIPQAQISSLEMAATMEIDESDALTAGYFQFEDKAWPVFCLSGHLEFLKTPSSERRVCILIQADNDYFSILCDQAVLLKQGVIQPQPLSESMMTADLPILALAIYNDEIVSISSANHLAKLLPLSDIRASANAELTL